MDFKKTVNENIKILREKNNLSQEQFAEMVGLSTKGVSNIERNLYLPKAKTIDKICEVFNITPDVLCRPAALPNKNRLDIIHHINSILGTLEVEELEQIFKIAKTFEK